MTALLDPPAAHGWTAVRAISPRPRVRVAELDTATGQPRNLYPTTSALTKAEPELPYAMYLADRAGRFRVLAFDLDAARGPVGEDQAQLTAWLDAAGIPHLITRSGPGGGRHVWAAIAGGAAASQVASVARALAARLPTLDAAPLLNPATGCVRPPGAPHRAGGRSQILAGTWEALTHPAATEASLDTLLAIVGPVATPAPPAGHHGIGVDDHGHKHLIGPRRDLPGASRRALETPLTPEADPSAVLWTALLGAARARWHYHDITALLPTAPGLEHARTVRLRPGEPARSPRPSSERHTLLARQWAQAVTYIAACGPDDTAGEDTQYLTRLNDVIATITHLQARAEACPGRWARPGGPADRRVLDHACAIALTAVRPHIDLDIRSVAVATGIGRETARTALHRLTADGWLTPLAPATGPHAAAWSLPAPIAAGTSGIPTDETRSAPPSTAGEAQPRSHVVPPPGRDYVPTLLPALPTRRAAWLHRLQHRLHAQAHDVFTGAPGGLGHHLGALYAAVEAGPATVDALALRTGHPPATVQRGLYQLHHHRLVRPGPEGRTWTAGSRRHRIVAAKTLGVHGVLAARARQIGIDRALWEWWLAELDWMRTPARQRPERHRHRRRPGRGQLALQLPVASVRQRRGPYPRHSGRADHVDARAQLAGRAVEPAA